MSLALFGRVWQFFAGDLEGFETRDLRIVFDVKKTTKYTPDTANFKVYNLSENTRKRLPSNVTAVIFQAGYGTPSTIYNGEVRDITSYREEADWCTEFQGGETELKRRTARVNESFSENVSTRTVIQKLFPNLGIGAGNLDDALAVLPGKKVYPNGYVAFGDAYTVFNNVMRDAGFSWTVSGGQVRVAIKGRVVGSGFIETLSPDTGVIGVSPIRRGAHSKKLSRLSIKCLLRPEIKVYQQVSVDMQDIKGEYWVEHVHHQGDTHGDNFTSTFDLVEVK